MVEAKQKCFVIMPFSETTDKHTEEYWTKHFKEFLKPLIESGHPLRAERSSPLRVDVVRQIITDLVTTPIVVADLTDANPNVYWELGVRQSFKHSTITIAEKGTSLPFDIGAKGTLFYYPQDHIKMQEFRKHFSEAIESCINTPNLPDSHVLETLSGGGTLYQILMRDECNRRLDALISEIDANISTLKDLKDKCKINVDLRKNLPSKRGQEIELPAVRFRICALDLLISSRYLEAATELYESAESVLDWLAAFNDQMILWSSIEERTELWILENHSGCKSILGDFMKLVKAYRSEAETIV